MQTEGRPPLATNRQALGQVVVCLGCCCGRTDRGRPAVPVERLESVWSREKLNRTIQLTVSGCLGPCDLANVAATLSPRGMEWIGGLTRDEDYDLLIEWARACHAQRLALGTESGTVAAHALR
jgi:cobaltochelatase CobN